VVEEQVLHEHLPVLRVVVEAEWAEHFLGIAYFKTRQV
jgi:hypothetical protein